MSTSTAEASPFEWTLRSREQLASTFEKKVWDAEKTAFEYEKKLFKMEQDYSAKEASLELNASAEKIQNNLEKVVEKAKRDTQSMLDKHVSGMEKVVSTPSEAPSAPAMPSVTIENVLPSSDKSITINRDENGMIEGADVNGG